MRIKAVSNFGSSGDTVAVHRLLKDWTQAGATWNCVINANPGNSQADCPSNGWVMGGSGQNAFVAAPAAKVKVTNGQTGFVSLDVTAEVQAFLAGTSNHGWIVKKAKENVAGRAVFYSKEASNVAYRPRLVLTSGSTGGVGDTPPDSLPAWFDDDSSYMSGVLKRVVGVDFIDGTPQAQRQAAVEAVAGAVVGGVLDSIGDGAYYLTLPDSIQPSAAVSTLMSLPQVEAAYRGMKIVQGYRRPSDGASGWARADWGLSPSGALGSNWSLEDIAAPFAWGCATGDTSLNIAIVDHAFDNTEVIGNARGPLPPLGGYPTHTRHGTQMANALAAPGDNGIGIAGTLWRAGLQLRETGRRYSQGRVLAEQIESAGLAGATVVNLSWYGQWEGNTPVQSLVDDIIRSMMKPLRRAEQAGKLPLMVWIAGEEGFPYNRDAYWSIFPQLKDSFPSRVIVVGGSTLAGTRSLISNPGSLVDIYAPGEGVTTLTAGNAVTTVTGSSVAATFVTGTAGLLKSFDPRLTPDSLRLLILQGATAGGLQVPGTSAYIVNAYESLKAAARRAGAPLCGNRLWEVYDSVIARRTSIVHELLFRSTPVVFDLGRFFSYHGGKRLDVNGNLYTWAAGTWAVNPSPSDTSLTGSSRSVGGQSEYPTLAGKSHDGDSTAVAVQTSTTTPTVEVRIGVTGSQATSTLGTFSGYIAGCCGDSQNPHLTEPAAYPPVGGEVVVALRNPDFGYPVNFYAITMNGSSSRLLFTLPHAGNVTMQFSEDGLELAVGYRHWYPDHNECVVEFRSALSGTLLESTAFETSPTYICISQRMGFNIRASGSQTQR